MADVRFDNWMSANDELMWLVERDPHLRSTIVSVMVLEGAPDHTRLQGNLERMIRAIPRLRQRVVTDALGVAPPAWETDPNFDYHYHVRHINVAAGEEGGDLQALLNVAATVGAQAFDKDRPLWEYYLVSGLGGGRTGLLLKLHHAISDGVGLVAMSRFFLDLEPDPAAQPDVLRDRHDAPVRTPMSRTVDALRWRAERNLETWLEGNRLALRGAGQLLRDPVGSLGKAREVLGSVGRLTRNDGNPLSPLLTGRSLSSDFRALEVPLADIKAAARAAGGTINDAFVAVVAGGLARYHAHHGRPVPALRMQMPVNVRARGDDAARAGNQFVPVRLLVPLDEADPAARMARIREAVHEQLGEPALDLMDEVASVLTLLPEGIATRVSAGMTRSVDFTTSNVPGIPVPVWVAGARAEAQYGFGPLAGAALNVTATSYNGSFSMALNIDRAAVPDPDRLRACLGEALDELLALAAPVAS